MWEVSGTIVNDQAIVRVGLREFLPQAPAVQPVFVPAQYQVASYLGLVDRGAQMSAISHNAVSQLGLTSHGKLDVTGAGGTWPHRRYWFYLGFFCKPLGRPHDENGETYFQLALPQDAIAIESNAGFDVIVGMDILKRCDMNFSRSGEFTITIYQ
ncbi:MAG: hypothetical protein SFV19_10050 [Rhodospirillaceae bacterium]|nr:hypothetical protein [Rhodospirillaceae bacterium]